MSYPGEYTGSEKRIRALEFQVQELEQALDSLLHRAGQAAEDGERQQQDDGSSRVFLRAQAVGQIDPSSGNALGNGTARLLQAIGTNRFKRQALADGDITVPVVNDTGGPIPDKVYLIVAVVDGLFTVIVADCATEAPVVAPDPPTS